MSKELIPEGYNFRLKDRLIYLWRVLQFLATKEYLYTSPGEHPVRWKETEYLKYCFWAKEAELLEKDVVKSFQWLKEAKEAGDLEEYRRFSRLNDLFVERFNRVHRQMAVASKTYQKKYGLPPDRHSLVNKDGTITLMPKEDLDHAS